MPLLRKYNTRALSRLRNSPLGALTEAVKAMSPRSLNLSRRTVNALSAGGVTKIRQLVTRYDRTFPKGKASNKDCDEALSALAKSMRSNGDVDWIKYAEKRGLLILPSAVQRTGSVRDFIEIFAKTAESAVRCRFGMKAVTVLKSRLLTPACGCPTLESVGKTIGVTKEAVRLIERDLIALFTSSVRYGEYEGCTFRFRPEFVQVLSNLISAVQSARKPVYSLSDWQLIVKQTWSVEPHEFDCAERLLLELVGLRKEFIRVPAFFSPSERKGTTLRTMLRETNRLLAQTHPQGLSPKGLRDALRQRLSTGDVPKLSELSELVSACPNLEKEKSTGRYRVRTECLTNSLDHYERILEAAGKPVHYSEIWQQARRTREGGHVSPGHTRSSLSRAARFVAIARSGFWALAAWSNVETRSTPEIAADILHGIPGPVTERALYALVAARRPVKQRSIWSQLAADPRFLRPSRGTWQLAGRNPQAVSSNERRKTANFSHLMR